MKQYHDYLKYILENGIKKEDRTGTGTISIFGYQMRFDLSKGFPLVTTKKLHFKSIAYELLWFLSGDTNIKFLNDNGVKIWDEWAIKDDYPIKGDLGPIYGEQWRFWCNPFDGNIDQISNVIEQIKNNPDSRRLIVSAWNVADLPDESLTPQQNVKEGNMALAPCHVMFQFYTQELSLNERYDLYCKLMTESYGDNFNYLSVSSINHDFNYLSVSSINHDFFDTLNIPKRKLSCMLTQRSADSFLGVPYNIASYSLLTHMIAQQCNLEVGEFIWSGGDCHIYLNHLEQVQEQLSREPFNLPTLNFKTKPDSIFDYKYENFEIVNYKAYPHIKGVVAV